MQKSFSRRVILCGLLAASLVVAAVECHSQQRREAAESNRAKLKAFLQEYVKDPAYDFRATRYFAAFVALQDHDDKQVIVYFTDRHSCGSGGCTALILTREGSSYRLITSMPIAQLPIRVLNTKSHGWHDIGVWVEGGGIHPGYEARLSFNGRTYTKNVSDEKVTGRIVVPRGTEGSALF